MRRRLLAFLLVPFILVAFISCEGDIFGTISDFMGQMGQNSLAETLSVPDANTNDLLDLIKEGSEEATVTGSGTEGDPTELDVSSDVEESMLDTVEKINASPSESDYATQQLKSKEIEDPVVEQGIRDIYSEIGMEGSEIPVTITEYDFTLVVLLQNVRNESDSTKKVEVAKTLVDFVKTTSPVGQIKILEAVDSLLDGLSRSMRNLGTTVNSRISGTSETEYSVEAESVDMLKSLSGILKTVLSKVDTNGNYSIEPGEYDVFGRDYAIIRKSYENLNYGEGETAIGMENSDLVNYAFSIIFTSGQTILPDTTYYSEGSSKLRFQIMLDEIMDFLYGSVDDKISYEEFINGLGEPNSEDEYILDGTMYDALFGEEPDYTFLEVIGGIIEGTVDTSDVITVKVENTLLAISRSLGIAALTEQLEKL